jgi:hypothetical protein
MVNNDGGPAFPSYEVIEEMTDRGYIEKTLPIGGMSLRDYFAAQALMGIMACPGLNLKEGNKYARLACELADAMLAERDK